MMIKPMLVNLKYELFERFDASVDGFKKISNKEG